MCLMRETIRIDTYEHRTGLFLLEFAESDVDESDQALIPSV